MSFSSKTKDELSVLRLKDDAVRLAALAGGGLRWNTLRKTRMSGS